MRAKTPQLQGNILSWVYLLLAIAGAVLPWQANLDFIQSSGGAFELLKFVQDANINAAARSLSRDLLIGATAITIWIVAEAKRLHVRRWWISLIVCISVSFACGAPLFLYLRERRLVELNATTEPDQ